MPQWYMSDDGSPTIYSEEFDAHYHSIFGAMDESVHVFIIAGLYKLIRQGYREIDIFEMGLGTGLNALLTSIESNKYNVQVRYQAVEAFPVDLETVESLNYPDLLGVHKTTFEQLHSLPWNTWQTMHDHFQILKLDKKIEDLSIHSESLDLIYWDAFAPSSQAHLWEEDIHLKIYNALRPYGTLVSYCSKGNFRRMLQNLGYKVERLNGPGKKREMIRAIKC